MPRFVRITLPRWVTKRGRRVRELGNARVRSFWEDERTARWRSRAKIVAFAVGGAFLALALFARVPADVGPFDTTFSARPALSGETVVHLAPLGDMRVDTHEWPLVFELRVDQLAFEQAELIAEDPDRIENLGDDVADELASAFRQLALRSAIVALLGGTAGAFLARHDWRSALGGAVTATVLVATFVAGTVATFDVQAVSEPRYSGLLTMTDRAVGDVESIIDRYDEYRAQLSELVGNVVTLYLAAEGLPTDDVRDDTVRVLHVADLHLSFHGLDVVERLVDQFDVDLVADSGDTTDWGLPFENTFVEELGDIDVPYLWVRGNHDSRGTQQAVSDLDNTIVLDDEAVTVGGLRFWGIGDPRHTPDRDSDLSVEEQREVADEYATEVADRVAQSPGGPIDVALVHDPRIAAELGGLAPLVLGGHTHEPEEYRLGEEDETIVLVEGSTGGAGLRGLQDDEPEPMTATVLYFDPDTNRLVAYDQVSVEGLGGGATIQRHVVLEPDTDADDSADADEPDSDSDTDADSDDSGDGSDADESDSSDDPDEG